MFRFCALLTAMLHERTALPSTITVQQPHCERPHPNFGPFNPSSSRKTYSSGVLGSASTTRDFPFTFSEIRAITSSLPDPNIHPVFPERKFYAFVTSLADSVRSTCKEIIHVVRVNYLQCSFALPLAITNKYMTEND